MGKSAGIELRARLNRALLITVEAIRDIASRLGHHVAGEPEVVTVGHELQSRHRRVGWPAGKVSHIIAERVAAVTVIARQQHRGTPMIHVALALAAARIHVVTSLSERSNTRNLSRWNMHIIGQQATL